MCLESSRPKGRRSSGSRCPQTMIPHRCGIQFGHRRPPSYLHIPRLLIFLILSPHQPLPFRSLFLASVCVVHNSALSSCPLFILFKCLLSSTQTQFRLICCVKLIKCPHSETTFLLPSILHGTFYKTSSYYETFLPRTRLSVASSNATIFFKYSVSTTMMRSLLGTSTPAPSL